MCVRPIYTFIVLPCLWTCNSYRRIMNSDRDGNILPEGLSGGVTSLSSWNVSYEARKSGIKEQQIRDVSAGNDLASKANDLAKR